MLEHIANRISRTDPYNSLLDSITSGDGLPGQGGWINLTGLSGSLVSAVAGSLFSQTGRTVVIVVPDGEYALPLYGDLKNFVPSGDVFHLRSRGIYPFQMKTTYFETSGMRLEALQALSDRPAVVVTTAKAIAERTMTPDKLRQLSLVLNQGQDYDLTDLAGYLADSGYERVGMVEEVGDFAVRGGLIDIFPASSEYPVRIEFFGDEIESIRTFSVSSQRSLKDIEKVTLLPRREFQMKDEALNARLSVFDEDKLSALHEALMIDDPVPGLEWLAPLAGEPSSSVTDYFPSDAIVFVSEPEVIEERINQYLAKADEYKSEAEEKGWPVCDLDLLVDNYGKLEKNPKCKIAVYPFKISAAEFIDFESYSPTISELKPGAMRNRIDELLGKGLSVFIACDNRGQLDRIEELLGEGRPELSFGVARIEHGFVYPHGDLAILTDHELFGHRIRRRPRRYREGISLPDYRSLNPNDFVVHIDFGIGQYTGLKTITVEGRRRDCLHIKYRDDDRIYVPIEQFNRVQKYSGAEGKVRLSKLGSNLWEKTVKRARRAVMDMAEELISIYAKRKVLSGHAYPPDSEWLKQLEASFPYEETPDQIKTLTDIKNDMTAASPMDRLICGDVGYGKTELAVRAAFKAADSGKQAAIIAPTTILVQQHFETFRERMKDFPIRVEMLSRFVERTGQKKVLEDLKNGRVDIVIGTHRLLGNDVQFRDIGMLIIDEEQRFGVTHKEKLKRWRTVVDVMTLTATPIPRTLQFSLLGARDMSIINTPPKDRRPIVTEVSPFSEKVITDAVLREIDRGGQVYFVHNRVQSIDAICRYLKKLLPNVSFVVAHGQMKERQLENIMHHFSRGGYQVLVSTTIIESGLDIPSVNTIIINRADKLGLAQLYQLRGRVGRSDRQAYAHFLIPPYRLLSDDAKKRLKAMEEFTALGSGFHLAMRDLEIRGAGNLLGKQQHGFIEEVGFDLYCRLLDEAVAEIKGEPLEEKIDAKLNLDCDLYIPESYIPEKDLRVDLYRRLADAPEYANIREIHDETQDRYGRVPDTVSNLFEMPDIRLSARKIGLARISLKGEKLTVEFHQGKNPTKDDVTGFMKAIDNRVEFFPSEIFRMVIFLDGMREQKGLRAVSDVMRKLASSMEVTRAESVL